MFSYSKTMAKFEVFCCSISSSINLRFLKSETSMTLVDLSCLSHMSDICDTFHIHIYWITKEKKMAPWQVCVFFFMGINDVLLRNLRMWLVVGIRLFRKWLYWFRAPDNNIAQLWSDDNICLYSIVSVWKKIFLPKMK